MNILRTHRVPLAVPRRVDAEPQDGRLACPAVQAGGHRALDSAVGTGMERREYAFLKITCR